ncbi:MAG: hypothetical protein QOE70_627 [Chthoniobacter sp.]|jgi:uncharacterized protein (TIGR03663 family)|nr:hypothetical protein [Chthoniobacter sp.]
MRGRWLSLGILALALALRLVLLGLKPAHFDEGVNGWFVDQMTKNGFYHYDPTNFHGPLHFYVLFVAQTLLGRHEWALRLPLALVSTACVAMVLAFRPYLGRGVCQMAALCMAVSPGFVFYGRYAIHESWQVFFLLLTVWGLAGLCHFGTRRSLWAAGLGLTGMVLTKETFIIHVVALGLGYATLWWLERYSPSAPFQPARQEWDRSDLLRVGAAGLGLVVLFYSGFLLDWSSLAGLAISPFAWAQTGMHGNTGHEKAPWYWLDLLRLYEWPALLGLAAAYAVVLPHAGRTLRWMTISGGGALFAYSIVEYKTPWCVISIMWPFYFTFGAAVVWAAERLDRWVVGAAAAVVLALSLGNSLVLNFRDYTREDEPYVYVQTLPEINTLLGPLRTLTAADRTNFHLPGYVVLSDTHPLPWLLGDFTHISFGNLTDLPEDVSEGVFFLTASEYAEEIEHTISGSFFREKITIRGNSGATQVLYLRSSTFGFWFPGREPEFNGPTVAPKPEAPVEPGPAPPPVETP